MKIINLRNFYSILAVVSSLAVIQSMLFPRWPQASRISSDKLSHFILSFASNGNPMSPTIISPDHSDFNISHSPIVSFKIDSYTDLLLTNVQVRDRADFSLSFITDSIKSLKLNPSAIKSKQPSSWLSEQTKAGTTYQSCFVSGNSSPSKFGVVQDQLSLAADQVISVEGNLGLKRFLGLSPSRRYQCILVTLKTTLPRQQSSQLWLDLLNKLEIAFNQ